MFRPMLHMCILHPHGNSHIERSPNNRYKYFHTFDANFRDPSSLPSDEDLQTAEISPDVIIDDVCILAPPGAWGGKIIKSTSCEDFRCSDNHVRVDVVKPRSHFFTFLLGYDDLLLLISFLLDPFCFRDIEKILLPSLFRRAFGEEILKEVQGVEQGLCVQVDVQGGEGHLISQRFNVRRPNKKKYGMAASL